MMLKYICREKQGLIWITGVHLGLRQKRVRQEESSIGQGRCGATVPDYEERLRGHQGLQGVL